MYSLVSEGSSGRRTMNMITYASPIALRPQRKYTLGLYVQSLTYQNMKETGRAVLQVCCAKGRAVGLRCTNQWQLQTSCTQVYCQAQATGG